MPTRNPGFAFARFSSRRSRISRCSIRGYSSVCAISTTLSDSTTAVPISAATRVVRLLVNAPMMSRLLVKISSAIIGSGSAMLKIT